MPEKSTDAGFERWHAEKYPPVGHCIYCGSTESLSDEHIIPFGLQPKGGDWFLPKASCEECAKITKGFEGSCLQGTLGSFRAKLNLKSRRKPKSTFEKTMIFRENDRTENKTVPLAELPTSCLGFNWQEAGLLRHIEPATEFEGELVVRYPKGEVEKYLREGEGIKLGRVRPLDYARMLAKIAHSYAVARFGESSFEPLLPNLIIGKDAHAPHLVGGDKSGAPLNDQPQTLHDIYPQACDIGDVPYLLIGLRLFAFMGMPRYLIATGKIRDGELRDLRKNRL